MTTWSGHVTIRLGGGNHESAVTAREDAPARAVAAAAKAGIAAARRVLGVGVNERLGAVIEVTVSLSRDGA